MVKDVGSFLFFILKHRNHHCLDGMHPVFRLVEHYAVWPVKYAVVNFPYIKAPFLTLRGKCGVEIVKRRKAVHEEDILVFRFSDQFFRNLIRTEKLRPLFDDILFAH